MDTSSKTRFSEQDLNSLLDKFNKVSPSREKYVATHVVLGFVLWEYYLKETYIRYNFQGDQDLVLTKSSMQRLNTMTLKAMSALSDRKARPIAALQPSIKPSSKVAVFYKWLEAAGLYAAARYRVEDILFNKPNSEKNKQFISNYIQTGEKLSESLKTLNKYVLGMDDDMLNKVLNLLISPIECHQTLKAVSNTAHIKRMKM